MEERWWKYCLLSCWSSWPSRKAKDGSFLLVLLSEEILKLWSSGTYPLSRFSLSSEDQIHNTFFSQVKCPTSTGVWFQMETELRTPLSRNKCPTVLFCAMKNLEKSQSGWIPKYFKQANPSVQTAEKAIETWSEHEWQPVKWLSTHLGVCDNLIKWW